MKTERARKLSGAAALGLVLLAGGGAQAATITLKVASTWPDKHPANVWGPELFMKEVTELTHGQVKFQWYPDGQLGKPPTLLQLTQGGGIDMLLAAPPYTPEKLPLSEVGGLPGLAQTACQISEAMQTLMTPDGILTKLEYTPLGLHPLFTGSPPPYEIMTTRKPVRSLADLKGLRLKAAGGAEQDAVRALGAVPVQMSSTDVYEASQRGVLDGRIGPYASVAALHEQHVLQFGTVGAGVGDFVSTFVINEKRWNSLPKDVQAAMEKAAHDAMLNSCRNWDASGQDSIDNTLPKQYGWKMYHLTPAQVTHWHTLLQPVQERWAKGMDRGGKSGSKVLAALKSALASQK